MTMENFSARNVIVKQGHKPVHEFQPCRLCLRNTIGTRDGDHDTDESAVGTVQANGISDQDNLGPVFACGYFSVRLVPIQDESLTISLRNDVAIDGNRATVASLQRDTARFSG